MAMAISTGLGRASFQPTAKAQGLVQRLTARFAAYLARRRELHELAMMSDRDLRDLAITRSDFPAIEAGTFRRDA